MSCILERHVFDRALLSALLGYEISSPFSPIALYLVLGVNLYNYSTDALINIESVIIGQPLHFWHPRAYTLLFPYLFA